MSTLQPLEIETGPEPRLSFLQREHWSPASFDPSQGSQLPPVVGHAPDADKKERRRRVKRICLSIQPCLGLQKASVLNQIEHVSSLWESFHSREPTGDSSQSIAKLRNTLLRMEQQWEPEVWQPFLQNVVQTHVGVHRENGSVSGAADQSQPCASTEAAGDQPLRDVCLYLLLWGELGNVRFCPELLCFLFASARAHLEWEATGAAVLHQGAAKISDGAFLEKIAKPIYVAMASETFNLQKHGPPKPKGAGGPALAAAANYDDWNELFWDPTRLVDNLVLDIPNTHAKSRTHGTATGSSLLEPTRQRISEVGIADPGEVWEMLQYVNWVVSLNGKKSHLEVHSLLPFLVGNSRIFMAQIWVLAALLVVAAQDPPASTWVRRSSVGLIAPAFRWFHIIGLHYLTPGIPLRIRLRDVVRLLVVDSLPVYTFAIIVLEGTQDAGEMLLPAFGLPVSGNHPSWLLTLHIGLTLYSLLAGVAARPQNIYRWNFYPMNSQGDTWASVLFWICVAASKTALDYKVAVQVDLTILRIWNPQWSELGTPLSDSMLFIRLLSMFLPVVLASLATTSLFVTFWVGLTGALRGVQKFGGLQPLLTRAGFAMMLIPGRTSDRVLQVSETPQPTSRLAAMDWWTKMSEREMKAFVEVWNTMLHELYLGDFLTEEELKVHVFESAALAREGPPHIPELFNQKFRNLLNNNNRMPRNVEARRRIIAFARSAQLGTLPREKATVRTMPSFSVLIPHYSETIMLQREALFVKGSSSELLRFLIQYYSDEFKNFIERLRSSEPSAERNGEASGGGGLTPGSFECFSSSSEQGRSARLKQVEMALCRWASQRLQTLWRTVEGICHAYEAALTMALKQQEPNCPPDMCGQAIKERFQVVVAMQQYSKFTNPANPGFDLQQAAAAEALLRTFGSSLSIGYIEEEPSSEGTRYYSCLIDDSCPLVDEKAAQESFARAPKFRVELPGFPILGNGKSDNQNCAIIFTRGEILQMIDANQDAYFEAGLFLPLALKEFATPRQKDGLRPGILGFREHIFSDIGLLGSWAASSEFAFGTIIQRTMDWPLNARLHYGHPDMLDKLQMVQQGGVSKATRGLNLSEDVFAGLDLTLRGGWSVYREYFHVGKGRDMGFMSVLGFHAKLSMGNGEQSISRQWLRAAIGLPFMRYAGIFFLHVGWYFNQCLINRALHATTFLAALTSASTAHHIEESRLRDAISDLIGSYFGLLYLCYVGASMVPLTLEILVEHGPIAAVHSVVRSILSLNPVFAAFQAKLIDYHFLNTTRFGGAKYIPTGRGLATAREPFLKLFRSFAMSHVYDALEIAFWSLVGNVSMKWRRGFELCIWFTVTSWIFAPFLFNPFQFEFNASLGDIRSWVQWIRSGSEREEEAWWAWAAANLQERRKKERGWEALVPSVGFLFACSTAVVLISVVETDRPLLWSDVPLLLPPLLHWIPCMLVACVYSTDHGKDIFLFLAVVAAGTAVPVWIYAKYVADLSNMKLPALLLHQSMALRWLLDSTDAMLARKLTTCPLQFMQRASRFWSLSWRLLRDATVGSLLLALCTVLSLIPDRLHALYLFRVPLLKSEGAQQESGDGSTTTQSEPDELLVRFFSHFAPVKSRSLASLFQDSVDTPSRRAEDSEPARLSLWHTMVRRFAAATGRELLAKGRHSRSSSNSSSSSPLSPSLEEAQDSLLQNSVLPSAAPETGMQP